MQRNDRKRLKASGIYKLDSLFENDGKLVISGTEHYIDGKLGEYSIVSVPETTTRASAIDLEQKLSKIAKKPILVVTHNIAFLKATLLTAKQRAELKEIIEKNTQIEEEIAKKEPAEGESKPEKAH